jgi:hypothetical protein
MMTTMVPNLNRNFTRILFDRPVIGLQNKRRKLLKGQTSEHNRDYHKWNGTWSDEKVPEEYAEIPELTKSAEGTNCY